MGTSRAFLPSGRQAGNPAPALRTGAPGNPEQTPLSRPPTASGLATAVAHQLASAWWKVPVRQEGMAEGGLNILGFDIYPNLPSGGALPSAGWPLCPATALGQAGAPALSLSRCTEQAQGLAPAARAPAQTRPSASAPFPTPRPTAWVPASLLPRLPGFHTHLQPRVTGLSSRGAHSPVPYISREGRALGLLGGRGGAPRTPDATLPTDSPQLRGRSRRLRVHGHDGRAVQDGPAGGLEACRDAQGVVPPPPGSAGRFRSKEK